MKFKFGKVAVTVEQHAHLLAMKHRPDADDDYSSYIWHNYGSHRLGEEYRKTPANWVVV